MCHFGFFVQIQYGDIAAIFVLLRPNTSAIVANICKTRNDRHVFTISDEYNYRKSYMRFHVAVFTLTLGDP